MESVDNVQMVVNLVIQKIIVNNVLLDIFYLKIELVKNVLYAKIVFLIMEKKFVIIKMIVNKINIGLVVYVLIVDNFVINVMNGNVLVVKMIIIII